MQAPSVYAVVGRDEEEASVIGRDDTDPAGPPVAPNLRR